MRLQQLPMRPEAAAARQLLGAVERAGAHVAGAAARVGAQVVRGHRPPRPRRRSRRRWSTSTRTRPRSGAGSSCRSPRTARRPCCPTAAAPPPAPPRRVHPPTPGASTAPGLPGTLRAPSASPTASSSQATPIASSPSASQPSVQWRQQPRSAEASSGSGRSPNSASTARRPPSAPCCCCCCGCSCAVAAAAGAGGGAGVQRVQRGHHHGHRAWSQGRMKRVSCCRYLLRDNSACQLGPLNSGNRTRQGVVYERASATYHPTCNSMSSTPTRETPVRKRRPRT